MITPADTLIQPSGVFYSGFRKDGPEFVSIEGFETYRDNQCDQGYIRIHSDGRIVRKNSVPYWTPAEELADQERRAK